MMDELQPKMVTRKTAAALYGYAPGTLANLLSQGRGPKAYRCGRRVLYAIEDLERFFKANPVLTRDALPEDQL